MLHNPPYHYGRALLPHYPRVRRGATALHRIAKCQMLIPDIWRYGCFLARYWCRKLRCVAVKRRGCVLGGAADKGQHQIEGATISGLG